MVDFSRLMSDIERVETVLEAPIPTLATSG